MPGRFFALVAALLIAGCSGGGTSAPAPAPVATRGQQTSGSITLTIGAPTGSTPAVDSRTVAGRKPLFISPGASSVGVSINGGADTFSDVSATSPNCTGAANARTCTIPVSAPSGTPAITVAIFDGPNGTGHLISQGSASPTVVAGQIFTVSITMLPVVKFLNTGTVTYASGTSFTVGTPGTATVTLGADDASLQAIPATATFAVPVVLSSNDAHVTITPASWTSPSQPITLTYDGSAGVAATVTLSFATGGVTLVSLPIMPTAGLSVTEFAVLPTAASEPEGITTGPDGALWFAEQTGNNIARITTAGAVTEFAVPTVNAAPTAVVTGSDGNLWFTEQQSSLTSKVGKINPGTHVFTEFSAGISPFGLPFQITSNPDGNLYFTEFSSNKIGRITTAGVVTEFTIVPANTEPSYIVTGPDGALWFTEPGVDSIGRMTTAGAFSSYPIPTVNSMPSGITVGPDGALWFLEEAPPPANKVGRITTAGVITNEFVIPTVNSSPMTIVTGADGNLWFTENANPANKIARLTPAGVFTEFPVPTPNSGPCSTTLGPDNHIWFAENNAAGNKIARI